MAPPPFRGGSCLFITLLLAISIGVVCFCVRALARLSQARGAKLAIWSVTTSLQLAPFPRTKTQEEVRTFVQGYSFLTQSYLSPKWHFPHITCRSCHHAATSGMNKTGCTSVWPRDWEDELPDMLTALPYTAIEAARCACSWATPRPSLGNWLLCILVSLGSEEEQACFDVLHK